MPNTNKIHIVVVGGGPSGLAFAQTAASKLCTSAQKNKSGEQDPKVEITVLEKRDYFFHAIGSLRALVDESFIDHLFIPYDNALSGYPGARIVTQAQVVSINYVTKVVQYMKNSENVSLQYDYLVLATGSSYTHPIKPNPGAPTAISATPREEQRHPADESRNAIKQSLYETNKKIQTSNRILVIGGGAVGIELAGELKSFYPEKKIMLLSSSPELLSNQNVPKMRRPVKKALENLGVELFLGQKIRRDMLPPAAYQQHQFGTASLETDQGLVIESDARIFCIGMSPNVDLVTDPNCFEQQTGTTEMSNRRGAIKVKENFQLLAKSDTHSDNDKYYDSVFVIGDASNHPTPKMAYWGMEQGKHLGKALADNILFGKPLKSYTGPSTEALMLPLGPNGGVSQLPLFGGMIVGNFPTKMIKSKNLFVEMFRKQLLRADGA
jgi:NADH dehydrogenase FAD-containing subunit